jgi:hypothetical protein
MLIPTVIHPRWLESNQWNDGGIYNNFSSITIQQVYFSPWLELMGWVKLGQESASGRVTTVTFMAKLLSPFYPSPDPISLLLIRVPSRLQFISKQ